MSRTAFHRRARKDMALFLRHARAMGLRPTIVWRGSRWHIARPDGQYTLVTIRHAEAV